MLCNVGVNIRSEHVPSREQLGTTMSNFVSQGLNLHTLPECWSCNISSGQNSLLTSFRLARSWKGNDKCAMSAKAVSNRN